MMDGDYTMGFPGILPEVVTRVPALVRNDGFHQCISCPKLILAEQLTCHECLRKEAAYDVLRKANARRETFRLQPRITADVVPCYRHGLESDEPVCDFGGKVKWAEMVRFFALAAFLLAFALWIGWHAIRDLVGLGLWLSR